MPSRLARLLAYPCSRGRRLHLLARLHHLNPVSVQVVKLCDILAAPERMILDLLEVLRLGLGAESSRNLGHIGTGEADVILHMEAIDGAFFALKANLETVRAVRDGHLGTVALFHETEGLAVEVPGRLLVVGQ